MVRSFAIVPAAGHSERMGAPKLLLSLGEQAVIEHVLAAWTASHVTHTTVVARADDVALVERCRRFPVDIVTPAEPPPDMRASVALAVAHIERQYAPADDDVWLLAPADMPGISPQVIDAVLAAYDRRRPTAIAPVHDGQRGHPTLLPWALAHQLRDLAADEGVNVLVARTHVREISCEVAGVLEDLDAPADYANVSRRWRGGAGDETAAPATGF